MTLILAIGDDTTPYQEVVVDEFPATVGRGSEANVFLNDRWASRLHCRFDLLDNKIVVIDLNSKHGTFVNGKRVERAQLNPGDKIAIGLTSFTAHVDSVSLNGRA